MKRCSKCGETKPFELFSPHKQTKDGRHSWCRACKNVAKLAYYAANREKLLAARKVYYDANRDQELARASAWHEANREKKLADNRARYHANRDKETKRTSAWRKANRHKMNALHAKRRAQKLKATPRWLTPEDYQAIQQFYRKAKELAEETGEPHHVDHIVPLLGKEVCGLHVPHNLQVITASENIRKNNRYSEELIYGG